MPMPDEDKNTREPPIREPPIPDQLELLQAGARELLEQRGFRPDIDEAVAGGLVLTAEGCHVSVRLSDPERVTVAIVTGLESGSSYPGVLSIDVPRGQVQMVGSGEAFTLNCVSCAKVATAPPPQDPDDVTTWPAERREQLQELHGRIAHTSTPEQLQAAAAELEGYTGRPLRALQRAVIVRRCQLELRAAGLDDAIPF